MREFTVVLMQNTVCLAALFLVYLIALKGLTFYQLRRVYLIGSVLIAITIPLIDIEVKDKPHLIVSFNPEIAGIVDQIEKMGIAGVENAEVSDSGPENSDNAGYIDYWRVLFMLYLGGAAFFLTRFSVGLFRIFTIARKSVRIINEREQIFVHPLAEAAFSFIKWIFIHPQMLSSTKIKAIIIKHESLHLRQGHSYDILFLELVKIATWFNPVIYKIIKEVSAVHEFYVDKVTAQLTGRRNYAKLLIRYATHPGHFFGDAFGAISIRQRIIQLHKKRSRKGSSLRIALVAPVLAGLFIGFSCSPEIEVQTVLPGGKKIKSIKVIYYDDYGDMPQYHEANYSSIEFDRSGKIIDLHKGTLHETQNDPETTVLPHFTYPVDKIIWFLDYGYYAAEPMLLGFDPQFWLDHKLALYEQHKDDPGGDLRVSLTGFGLPAEAVYRFHENRFESHEYFEYDERQRVVAWTSAGKAISTDGQEQSWTNALRFAYNPAGQLATLIEDDKEINIFYNTDGRIAEVAISKLDIPRRRFVYAYNDLGLRARSIAFNREDQQEFEEEYVYDFY
jgi:BlaR1 peptidase M56